MHTLLAQNLKFPDGSSIQGPLNISGGGGTSPTIGGILSTAIPLIFAFAGLGLLIMLISSGYTFLTSAGDAKNMEKGKQQLTFAIVGFLIVFAAYWVVQLTGAMFGLQSMTTVFK
jgi:hypothetical protein